MNRNLYAVDIHKFGEHVSEYASKFAIIIF